MSAEVVLLTQERREAVDVSNAVSVEVAVHSLDESERAYVVDGIRMVARHIRAALAHDSPILICVTEVIYNPTDYQSDALKYVAANWAANEFHFDVPHVQVSFNKAQNKYIFVE